MCPHPTGKLHAEVIVPLSCVQVQKVLLHATDRAVDGHVVVIQDDKQVVR